ncbi:two-component system response regulator [Paenibacillus flagellatus]|uniref:Two-component system response regulator n=1 Tax=Paenibacillus flagellatus TaxID=2211139 RepID=A0A2V5KAQ7_9BACL|nr:two-component system response regulator [Paenibacillus flagellatus]
MPKVMIVDDAAFMRAIIKDIVVELGWEASEAAGGAEAVAVYNIVKPDLVTMDITMPEMDGITALRKLIRLDPGAKVVMISAMSHHHQVIESVRAGAVDFIAKPLLKDRVKLALERALSRKTTKPAGERPHYSTKPSATASY